MDFNIEVRLKQLENLEQFISSSRDRVDSILDYLGWTKEKLNETHKEMTNCKFDLNHRIPVSKAAEHMQECAFRREGYRKNEKLLSEPNFIPGSSILIDDATKIQVLTQAVTTNPLMKTGWRSGEPNPRSSDKLMSVYTSDERSALYDYAIANTSGPPQVPEFNITEPSTQIEQNLPPDQIEQLQKQLEISKQRDAHRRRIKHKAKNVHTSGKTTTEIIREVINGQMEVYEDWLQQQIGVEHSNTCSRSSSLVSSSKHSYEEEKKNGYSHSQRSLSKESEKSKHSDRSKERFSKEKHDERYRKYKSNHRSRSSSKSRRYENEKRYKDRDDKYEPRKHEGHRRERSERDRSRRSRERHDLRRYHSSTVYEKD